MQVRTADNRDLDDIRRVVFSVLAEYGLSSDGPGVDSDLADLEASYFKRGGIFEVVEDDGGRIVGTMGVMVLQSRTCELRKMYLLPEFRGRGLGRRLLERAMTWAREEGFERMELETAQVLVEAIGLYRRYGFEPLDRATPSGQCDQAYAVKLVD